MFKRIEPREAYILHRLEVIACTAVAERADDGEYMIVCDQGHGRVPADSVYFTESAAREACVSRLRARMLIEETRLNLARIAEGSPCDITDVDYREIAPVAG